jgi:hypothetical protein
MKKNRILVIGLTVRRGVEERRCDEGKWGQGDKM